MPDIKTKKPHATAGATKLSERSQQILSWLSEGLSEEAILSCDPTLSRHDLARAAKEALVLHRAAATHTRKVSKVLRQYPRAYDKWSPDEEMRVAELYNGGKTLREIAAVVGRQPRSVRARLEKLGLFR